MKKTPEMTKQPLPALIITKPLSSKTRSAALGGFERINFHLLLGYSGLDMSSHVAWSIFPFLGRFGAGRTKPASLMLQLPVATVTIIHDRMTGATVVGTSICGHKSTFNALSCCLANH